MCLLMFATAINLFRRVCINWGWCALIRVCPLTGISSVGSYPIGRGLPADPGNRHGYHAGEDYDHKEGLHHLCAGRVCPRR